MRLSRLPLLFSVIVLAVIAVACGEEEVRKFARGASGTASGISVGIDTVRAFREAGEIDAEKALELAKGALDVNTLMGESVDFTLKQEAINESQRQTLHQQYSDISARARRLVQSGTIRIKNEKVKLAFTLGTIAGQGALDAAVDDLGAKLPAGVTIPVDDETRKTLEQAREKIRQNDKRLREAIENLERMIRNGGDFGGAGSGGQAQEGRPAAPRMPSPESGELLTVPVKRGRVRAAALDPAPRSFPARIMEPALVPEL